MYNMTNFWENSFSGFKIFKLLLEFNFANLVNWYFSDVSVVTSLPKSDHNTQNLQNSIPLEFNSFKVHRAALFLQKLKKQLYQLNTINLSLVIKWYSANIYLFKENNKISRKRSKICLKVIVKTPERRDWH